MYKTLSFGEVLWDVFPSYKKPGGSPANLAYHLRMLGNHSYLLSRIGNEEEGRELLDFLRRKGIPGQWIQTDSIRPTGRVTVRFRHNEPEYTIHEPAAWDFIEVTDELKKELPTFDAFCFASLSGRNPSSAKALGQILDSLAPSCMCVFDVNLRPPFIDKTRILESIEKADVVKVNEQEHIVLSGWLQTEKPEQTLLNRHPGKTILVTMGEKGSRMHTSSGSFVSAARPVTGNGDFVGAGDAFLACFVHLKLNGVQEDKLLDLSNQYAAYVGSLEGGMPDMPDEWLTSIETNITS